MVGAAGPGYRPPSVTAARTSDALPCAASAALLGHHAVAVFGYHLGVALGALQTFAHPCNRLSRRQSHRLLGVIVFHSYGPIACMYNVHITYVSWQLRISRVRPRPGHSWCDGRAIASTHRAEFIVWRPRSCPVSPMASAHASAAPRRVASPGPYRPRCPPRAPGPRPVGLAGEPGWRRLSGPDLSRLARLLTGAAHRVCSCPGGRPPNCCCPGGLEPVGDLVQGPRA